MAEDRQNFYAIKETDRIRTTVNNREFYDQVIKSDSGFINKHQLFTYAFLVAMYYELTPCTESKTEDICQVSNVNPENWDMVLGIAAKKITPEDEGGILKRILEYADAGIQYLRDEFYKNEERFRLDKFIN